MSNYNGDLLDDGLQAVMGKDRCQNDWQPSKKPVDGKKEKDEVRKDKPVEAKWEPVKTSNWLDKLMACAKGALLFGGLSTIFFYWQQTGQMQSSAALPSICTCMLLTGICIGKNVTGGAE